MSSKSRTQWPCTRLRQRRNMSERPSELLVGHSSSYPGCLSAIITLTLPLEARVQQFREEFSHSMAEVRSRLAHLVGRAETVGEETATLTQRTDSVEKEVAEVRRQTSDLSEKLESSLTECGKRQEEVEQQAVNLEVRTTLLENHDHTAVTRDMSKLAEQMEEMRERLALAESDAAKAKIARDDLQQSSLNIENRAQLTETDQRALLDRLTSLDNRFEASFPGSASKPLRSISSP
jgi:chromosome segregation ATPase